MKTKTLLLIGLITFLNSNGQFSTEQIITTEVYPGTIITADLDGDGDMDVISNTWYDASLVWFENTDGLGNFGTMQIIEDLPYSINLIFASDLDGDNDLDILTCRGGFITWFENLDGQGNFGPHQIIPIDDARGGSFISASDLDGDDDMDVVALFIGDPIAQKDPKLVWFENLDGQGNFGTEIIITTEPYNDNRRYGNIADLDGDGDIDIIASDGGTLEWYKNSDGQGNFIIQQITVTGIYTISEIFASDIDNDGDKDIIISSSGDLNLLWLENVDGNGNFLIQHDVVEDGYTVSSIYPTDIDKDGDIDIASTTFEKIQWHSNLDGNGDFGPSQVIATELDWKVAIKAADLDGDTDMDILTAFANDTKIIWYENLTILGISDLDESLDFDIFPNPTNSKININSLLEVVHIDVYNQLGQLVLSVSNTNNLDVSTLNSGIYFMKIRDEKENIGIKKIVKE